MCGGLNNSHALNSNSCYNIVGWCCPSPLFRGPVLPRIAINSSCPVPPAHEQSDCCFNRFVIQPKSNLRRSVSTQMITSVPVTRGIESLFGTRDANIRLLESGLGVSTRLNTDTLAIEGEPAAVARAEHILQDYFALVKEGAVFK